MRRGTRNEFLRHVRMFSTKLARSLKCQQWNDKFIFTRLREDHLCTSVDQPAPTNQIGIEKIGPPASLAAALHCADSGPPS